MSKEIKLKDSVIGGGSRVTVQSMLNVPAADVAGSVMQAVALERAGCERSEERRVGKECRL